jgi:2-iminobutanoate/2-iminopropanoate deaminase
VAQVTVLLRNPTDFEGMNESYAETFATEQPTRAVAKLGVELPGILVSIMMTAQVEE